MNAKHFPDLELCKKLTEAGFPETEEKHEIRCEGHSDTNGDYITELVLVCPSVMELLDFIRKKDISLNYTGTINFLSPELPDALSELILIYLQNNGKITITTHSRCKSPSYAKENNRSRETTTDIFNSGKIGEEDGLYTY